MPLLKFYNLDTVQKFFSRLKVLALVFEVFWTFALRIEKFGINLEVFRAIVVTDGHFFDVRCISEVFTTVFLENS